MTVAVVIVAAGKGERLGAAAPKALVAVAGYTLLEYAVYNCAQVTPHLVVVAPPGQEQDFLQLLTQSKLTRPYAHQIQVVAGGESRAHSVQAGLAAIPSATEVVLVHDAARAFQRPAVMDQVVAAVRSGAAGAVPVVPVIDTVVRISSAHLEPLPRAELFAVQTPQGFAAELLARASRAALAAGELSNFTDESTLMFAAGYQVVSVPGAGAGFKVTTLSDLLLAQEYAQEFLLVWDGEG